MCGWIQALLFFSQVVALSLLDSLHHAFGRAHNNRGMVRSGLELYDLDHIGELDSVGLSGLQTHPTSYVEIAV